MDQGYGKAAENLGEGASRVSQSDTCGVYMHTPVSLPLNDAHSPAGSPAAAEGRTHGTCRVNHGYPRQFAGHISTALLLIQRASQA